LGDNLHIPDGYLGPYTYITLYLVMIPIWLYAGHKMRRELRSRQVPLLAFSAAFAFVIMMFNVPVPGGSTGHAVGGAIIGIVLGPWAAVISISVTLVLQALIFGDGGITTIGANCFNMAVVIPFAAYYSYRLISGTSDLNSSRRLIAAAIAGYLSLSLAAGVTGFELGLQPILEHDANGTPLYMPYGLNVTIPAMLLENMLFFGFVEALVTALIFAYVRRTDPSLLTEKSSKPV
jgi:cobalt/nickel transport system permease protein